MLFNSYIFIFAFLPITFIVYRILLRLGLTRVSLCALIVASLIFYGYQNPKFDLLLIASIAVNYSLQLGFEKAQSMYLRKAMLAGGLIYNFGILFYFKYLNFFMENIDAITGGVHTMREIVLPLGISFYTFQQVSFVIDCYNKKVEHYGFIEYALFVCFFPQLIAGPIVLHGEMIPQFRNREIRIKVEQLYEGLQYFILGLGKKILIADVLGRGVNWGYENILWLNSLSAIILILTYTLQIYFDFSGYCDMAIGLGKCFGFNIVDNFNSPYKALSVSDFWKRWHMTLTRFFTTYLYIPLGGNRRGKIRTLVNVMIVFVLSGLWHGADWTFVAWGAMHGIMMVLERIIGQERLEKIPKVTRFLYTFGFVNCAWVFFRADNFTDALNVFKRILHGGSGHIIDGMRESIINNTSREVLERMGFTILERNEISIWLVYIIIAAALYISTRHSNTGEIVGKEKTSLAYTTALAVIFILSVLALSGVSTFLYFNF